MNPGMDAGMDARFGLGLDDFGRRYLRPFEDRYALVDGSGGNCIFLEGKSCGVYGQRPVQCRAFPWWPATLRSADSWQRAAEGCEGISELAPRVVADVIDANLEQARKAGLAAGFSEE